MIIHSDIVAERLVAHWQAVEVASLDTAYTNDDLITYGQGLDWVMSQTHKVNRGIREIAAELDINVGQFEDHLKGKRILDIGCGVGVFATQVARLKKTEVVALDNNPDVLDKIPRKSNLRVVQGSGDALDTLLPNEEFDVVISSFSSIMWARTPQMRRQTLDSAFSKTSTDGELFIIPFLSNPTERRLQTMRIMNLIRREDATTDQYLQASVDLSSLLISLHMDKMSQDTINEWLETDAATIAYRANRGNSVMNTQQERYSAVVKRLS